MDSSLVEEKQRFLSMSRIIISIILVIFFTLSNLTPLSAIPLSEKKAQEERLINEIYNIHEELDEVVEKYNFYRDELNKVNSKIIFLEKQKKELNFELNLLKDELNIALREIYKYGQLNIIQILSFTYSINDLLERVKFFSIAGDNHAQLIIKFEKVSNEITVVEQDTEKHKKILLGLLSELKLIKDSIEEKIREKERLLANVKQDIEILERIMYAPVTNFISPADYGGIVSLALSKQGKPYVWGASGPNSFDCSGFVYWVFKQFGTYLPRAVRGQYKSGISISKSDLQQGDLVFFKNFTHVGIYIGNGNFVHAPHNGTVVRVESLSRPYRIRNYCGACRI